MKNAISAGHELTLEVGKEILHAGGNAFDAVTAAYFAMFITEPCMASAGGNGFALAKPNNEKVRYFDFFSQTPANNNLEMPEFYPITVDFGGEKEEFNIGIGSAAVPGAIAGILEIHKQLGSIPVRELIQPAAQLAKKGVVLNEFQAYDIFLLQSIFGQSDRGKEIFFRENNIKIEGERIWMPQMADFLEFIAREGKRGFYEGEIACSIVKDSQESGGFLSMEDFENYEVIQVDPLKFPYRDKQLYVPNFPNNGGVALALFLGELDHHRLSIPLAIHQAQQSLMDRPTLVKHINALYPDNNCTCKDGPGAYGGTSHLNILDKRGNAVSLTSSIGEGSGYFIPGTDMQLNNMLGELYLLPGGKHSWSPNTRMQSMMTPTLITDDKGSIEFLAGSGGASRIPFAVGQVIQHHFSNQQSLQEAVEAPRFHVQNRKIQVEGSAVWDEAAGEAKYWDKKSLYFGGVHAISQRNKKLEAVGDSRRFGVAEVF